MESDVFVGVFCVSKHSPTQLGQDVRALHSRVCLGFRQSPWTDSVPPTLGPWSSRTRTGTPGTGAWTRFFLIYFSISFFTKNIFLFSKFTGIYLGRPAAGRPGPGRPAAGRQGLFCKNFARNFYKKAPGGQVARQRGGRPPGRPAAGRRALAARQEGDRLPRPYIRVGWSPHSSFASLKFQKPRKEREGGREAKPYRILEPATAGNQNFFMLYK